MRDPAMEPRAPREMNWERRGPLAPLAPQEGAPRDARGPPEGLGERGDSHRGSHQGSASWGEGRQEGSRPPRRDPVPEREPTAAEKDMQWRDRMRPTDKKESPAQEGDAPASPTPAAATPASRPRLNLQKRTVTENTDAPTAASSDSKASPFGAARPINTAAREQEIEEKRQQAIREKREADEKAKEEKRLAKQAAAEKAAEATAQEEEAGKEEEAKTAEEGKEQTDKTEAENGASDEQKSAPRTREPKEAPKSRSTEAGNWRSASGEQRAPRGASSARGARGAPRGPRNDGRGPRANGASAGEQTAARESDDGEATPVIEDGWTTVPNKKGRQGRPVAS